jgi:hypothetical protein
MIVLLVIVVMPTVMLPTSLQVQEGEWLPSQERRTRVVFIGIIPPELRWAQMRRRTKRRTMLMIERMMTMTTVMNRCTIVEGVRGCLINATSVRRGGPSGLASAKPAPSGWWRCRRSII